MFLNGGRESGRSLRLLCETYENKIAELENERHEYKKQLTKAIGIIKRWYETNRSACIEPSQELIEVTEQFLKEIEK